MLHQFDVLVLKLFQLSLRGFTRINLFLTLLWCGQSFTKITVVSTADKNGVKYCRYGSGAGKSTLMLDLLSCQAEHGNYLGHAGGGLRFLVLFADRPQSAVDETLERMRLVDRIPCAHLSVSWGVEAACAILAAIEEHDVPQILFLEGADALVEEPSKPQSVAPFLHLLQDIAQHYALAMILSVGAPKTKPGEGYALKRDRIFGSQIWPRMAETILIVSETADGARELDVLHRNAKSEHFDLQFSNGLLVLRDRVSDEQAVLERDVLWQWVVRRGARWFTRAEAVKAMEDADAGLARSTVYGRLRAWINQGWLESDGASGGKEYLRRRQP